MFKESAMSELTTVGPLIRALVATFVDGGGDGPELPAGRREEVVTALTRAMCGPAPLAEYVRALDAECGRRGVGKDAVGPEPGAEFPAEAVLARGLGVLTDGQLAGLATSRAAVILTAELVEEARGAGTAGDCWWDAYDLFEGLVGDDYLGPAAAARALAKARRFKKDH